MTGRLIGVVGPSGAGKDTVMQTLAARDSGIALVRRVITRDATLGGEEFDAVSETEFERRYLQGDFCVAWRAHGLRYGIPNAVGKRVGAGEALLVNLSRDVLGDVAAVFPCFEVLHVTASAETLAARLAGRGRENTDEIARRLSRAARPLAVPASVPVITIHNDGLLEETIQAAIKALYPVRA